MQTIPLRLSRWKRNQRLTSFIHLPFRSSEQIGSSPASDSVTFQTGEPEGAFCSASEDEASRLVLVGLSPSSIQRDTQITQPPPPTPFPDSTVKGEKGLKGHLLGKYFTVATCNLLTSSAVQFSGITFSATCSCLSLGHKFAARQIWGVDSKFLLNLIDPSHFTHT